MSTRLLTTADVAERLQVSTATVTNWFRSGHLPGRNLANGRRKACWRIAENELDAWVKSRPTA